MSNRALLAVLGTHNYACSIWYASHGSHGWSFVAAVVAVVMFVAALSESSPSSTPPSRQSIHTAPPLYPLPPPDHRT